MTKNSKKSSDPLEDLTLPDLCSSLMSLSIPFEDACEFLENRTYALCVDGKCEAAVKHLAQVAQFFETMENKNEENCRDLADIYILIGEVHQYVGSFEESIDWFRKAAVVCDRYATPFHNLATSYQHLGDIKNAVRSLEQEIGLEPGNYFSRLRLADLYEQQGEFKKEVECLENLLSRNPDNIQALHKLITHYEQHEPGVDIHFLRHRLVAIDKKFNEIEMVIRVYHLCTDGQLEKTLRFLDDKLSENPAITMLHLLKAHVLGQLHQFARKRLELSEFKRNCHGKAEFMKNKLEEFEHVFGKKAVTRLGKILVVTNANVVA